MQSEEIEFHPVDPSLWPDLVRLFEGRGGPSYCWCMVWRGAGNKTSGKKAALADRVSERTPVGLLGYQAGEPVAWCSIAPRETYRPLGGPDDSADAVWSLVCFYIVRRLRGQGLTERLIEAAVNYAGEQGGDVVEAYPVDPDSPSYLFMGFVPVFARNGFKEVGRAGKRRHVMRRRIS